MSLKKYPGELHKEVRLALNYAHKAFEADFPDEELQEEIMHLRDNQGWLVAKKDGKSFRPRGKSGRRVNGGFLDETVLKSLPGRVGWFREYA